MLDGYDSTGPVPEVEVLYREHSQQLARFATTLVGSADGPDVVATVFARLLARPGAIRTDARAYLFRATYNECLSLRRRVSLRERHHQGSALIYESEPARDPAVAAAVAALPVRQRAVVILTYWRDWAPKTVAEHLGISEGATKKHLARGRAALRTALSTHQPEDRGLREAITDA
jgi:RNA polymerase sigma factor (sigma-70 family)